MFPIMVLFLASFFFFACNVALSSNTRTFAGMSIAVTYSHPANPFHRVDFDPFRLAPAGGSFQGAALIDACGKVAGEGASKGSVIVMDHPFNDVAGCTRPANRKILHRSLLFQNGLQAKPGFEMCFGHSTLLGAGAKTRVESRIKKFTPYYIFRPVQGGLKNDVVLACKPYFMSMVTVALLDPKKVPIQIVRSPTRTDGEPPALHHPLYETNPNFMVLQDQQLSYHITRWQLDAGYVQFTASGKGTVSPPIYFRHKGGCSSNGGYPRLPNLSQVATEAQLVNGATAGAFYGPDYTVVRLVSDTTRFSGGGGRRVSIYAPGMYQSQRFPIKCPSGSPAPVALPPTFIGGTDVETPSMSIGMSVTRNEKTGDVSISGEACLKDEATGTLHGADVYITHPATSALIASAGNTGSSATYAPHFRILDRMWCFGQDVNLEDNTPQRYTPGAGGVQSCIDKCKASTKCTGFNYNYIAQECRFFKQHSSDADKPLPDLIHACYASSHALRSSCTQLSGARFAFAVTIKGKDLAAKGVNDYRVCSLL